MWPREFDRYEIVQALVALLSAEKDAGMAAKVEEALIRITGQRLRTRDPETKQEVPNIEAWNQWTEANKARLAMGNDPLDLP